MSLSDRSPLSLAYLVGSLCLFSSVLAQARNLPAVSVGVLTAATDDAKSAQRWILLQIDEELPLASKEQVRADLQAGLSALDVVVSLDPTDGGGAPPSARVVLRATEDGGATVEVLDNLTNKRLERDIELSGLPEDGHALALALAADELLRASWAELDLKRQNQEPPPTGPASPDPPEPESDEGVDRVWFLLLGPNITHFSRGSTFLGGELGFGRAFGGFRLSAHLLGAGALSREFAEGTLTGTAFGGAFRLGYDLASVGLLRIGPELGFQALWSRFEGQPTAGRAGASLEGLWLSPQLGGFVRLEGERVYGVLSLGVGYALSSVVARADGRPIGGVAGFFASAGLGVGVKFQ